MNDIDLSVNVAGIQWKNPVTSASGTLSVSDTSKFYDLNELGAVTTKGVASEPWAGNPTPRIAEVYGGMLNAVGLQNPGADYFLSEEMDKIEKILKPDTPLIVNVAGRTVAEYCLAAEKLAAHERVDMLEINISCPNVKEGGASFGTSPQAATEVTRAVRRVTDKPIIMKLTPNVTDIAKIAQAVESEGADALSLINTLLGMKIDIRRKKPVLANKMGGFSGPAVKPVAVRMVYEVRRAVKLPVIGLGGIMTGEDAVEFFMAGADAVAVGTAALVDPGAPLRIKREIADFMRENGYKSVSDMRMEENED